MRRVRSRFLVLSASVSMVAASPCPVDAQNLFNATWLQTFLSPEQPSTVTEILFGSLGIFPNSIAFDLRQFDGHGPIGPSLFYVKDPNAHPQGPYSLPLNVALAPNTVYAIVLEDFPDEGGGFGTMLDSRFAGGDFWDNTTNGWVSRAPFDFAGFNVLFDDATPPPEPPEPPPTVAPEPSTLTLMASGMAAMLVVIRLRRRTRGVTERST